MLTHFNDIPASERIIVALDCDAAEAKRLAGLLAGKARWLKVGMTLYYAEGPSIVKAFKDLGFDVFLDLKFHDIPHQVEGAAASAVASGADMLTMHASGGVAMMQAAQRGVERVCAQTGRDLPATLGITVLTSMDEPTLKRIGVERTMEEQVGALALLAKESGISGVVASPQEARMLRDILGPDAYIVTPGVRPAGSAKGDQSRIATPADAFAAGAKSTIPVAVACAMAGVIAGCITVTGLASTIINVIVLMAGDFVMIGLVFTMICCLILGMGVPTTANYCIMASTCAPILIQLGIDPICAHFFVFYFGIAADITPPVALAAYAASAIAKSRPMMTAVNATKLGIAKFVVPYIFCFSPVLLMVGDDVTVLTVILNTLSALGGMFGIQCALTNTLFERHINPLFRILLAAGGLGMMIPGAASDVAGLVLILVICGVQFLLSRKDRDKTPPSDGDAPHDEGKALQEATA